MFGGFGGVGMQEFDLGEEREADLGGLFFSWWENDCCKESCLCFWGLQRQTVVSQFYQLDRLVVEGQRTVSGPLRFPLHCQLQIPNYSC